MISAWWLLTLIPAVWIGIFVAGLLFAAREECETTTINSTDNMRPYKTLKHLGVDYIERRAYDDLLKEHADFQTDCAKIHGADNYRMQAAEKELVTLKRRQDALIEALVRLSTNEYGNDE